MGEGGRVPPSWKAVEVARLSDWPLIKGLQSLLTSSEDDGVYFAYSGALRPYAMYRLSLYKRQQSRGSIGFYTTDLLSEPREQHHELGSRPRLLGDEVAARSYPKAGGQTL